jgi:hypothetical protein
LWNSRKHLPDWNACLPGVQSAVSVLVIVADKRFKMALNSGHSFYDGSQFPSQVDVKDDTPLTLTFL